MTYKQDFPVQPLPHAPSYIQKELKKIDGYKGYSTGNRVIEYDEDGKGKPALDEDGKLKTVDNYITVTGSDSMDEAKVKAAIDKYIAEYPAYAENKATEYEALQYARKRHDEYPDWRDQLDKIYNDGLDAWKASIKTVKDKYPKP